MKESVQAAHSYVRARAEMLGLDPNDFDNFDMHIHFPEGAVPKDGPSAGIPIVMAIASALAEAPIRNDVAMTGEVTLRGRVLPVGGLREKVMGARATPAPRPSGFYDQMKSLGWGVLVEEPSRLLIAGSACQPWQADVTFTPIAAEEFAAYAEPDRMKIAWTIEVESLGPDRTRCLTETRAVATDAAARAKFLKYWRRIVIGVVAIRWLLLRGVRREAERRWRGGAGA